VLSDILPAGVLRVKFSPAISGKLPGAGSGRIDIASPVSTEVVREDEALVFETLFNVASRAGELGRGRAELAGVWAVGVEACGN
jgi:hypothetical protein